MEWVPAVKLEVANVAVPPLTFAVPSVAAPSRKVTVPVAPAGETVAVKVTACPKVDGLRLEATPVVVFALLTLCDTAAEVLVL